MGFYDDRAHLVGRKDSQWTPDWSSQAEEIFPPLGSPEAETEDIDFSVGPVMSQASLATPASGEVFPAGLPSGEGLDCQACYGALVSNPYGDSDQFVAFTDPNDTDGTWEVDGITGPLTGSTPGSNPIGARGADAPQVVPQSLVAAPSGNQPDNLNVTPGSGSRGDQGPGQPMSLRELAKPAPGTGVTTPVYKS